MPVSIGVSFPESIMPGTPLPDIAGLAGFAEQAGLDGVWVGDRLPGLLAGQPLPHGPGASGGDAIRLRPAVPVPPLWVGGTSPGALRRAVRLGDGWLSGLQTPREFAASRRRLFELSDEAGRPRPLTGIGLHAAIGTSSGRDLAAVTAGMLNSMYGVPADRAREVEETTDLIAARTRSTRG